MNFIHCHILTSSLIYLHGDIFKKHWTAPFWTRQSRAWFLGSMKPTKPGGRSSGFYSVKHEGPGPGPGPARNHADASVRWNFWKAR
jgi:hypothetical protein